MYIVFLFIGNQQKLWIQQKKCLLNNKLYGQLDAIYANNVAFIYMRLKEGMWKDTTSTKLLLLKTLTFQYVWLLKNYSQNIVIMLLCLSHSELLALFQREHRHKFQPIIPSPSSL